MCFFHSVAAPNSNVSDDNISNYLIFFFFFTEKMLSVKKAKKEIIYACFWEGNEKYLKKKRKKKFKIFFVCQIAAGESPLQIPIDRPNCFRVFIQIFKTLGQPSWCWLKNPISCKLEKDHNSSAAEEKELFLIIFHVK